MCDATELGANAISSKGGQEDQTTSLLVIKIMASAVMISRLLLEAR